MLVIDTDHTVNVGPIFNRVRAPLVRVYAACDGCRVPLSEVRYEDSDFDHGWCWAQADRLAAGQRVEGRVHRHYCAACWQSRQGACADPPPPGVAPSPEAPPLAVEPARLQSGQLGLFGGAP